MPNLRTFEKQSSRSTLTGLIGALLLLFLAVVFGDRPSAFVNWRALAIVVGGTAGLSLMSFSWREVKHACLDLAASLMGRGPQPDKAALQVLDTARKAKRLSHHGLARNPNLIKAYPQFARALGMLETGVETDHVEEMLREEFTRSLHRRRMSSRVCRRAAEVASAMGLVGTLIALVNMLGALTDPAQIGPALSLALLSTLYGALLAHVLFLPLAAKIERDVIKERTLLSVYRAGARSIASDSDPEELEHELSDLLPQSNPEPLEESAA